MSGRASEFAFHNFRGHAKIEDWEIEDPYGDPEKYQGTYEHIQRRVAELTRRLRKESGKPEDGIDNTIRRVPSRGKTS
jgi:hypothetical protein